MEFLRTTVAQDLHLAEHKGIFPRHCLPYIGPEIVVRLKGQAKRLVIAHAPVRYLQVAERTLLPLVALVRHQMLWYMNSRLLGIEVRLH